MATGRASGSSACRLGGLWNRGHWGTTPDGDVIWPVAPGDDTADHVLLLATQWSRRKHLDRCIDAAIALRRPLGSFVWQGNYGEAPIALHLLPPHVRRLRMFFPCHDGLQPRRRAILRNVASGALRWDRTITHRIACAEAPAIYRRIHRGNLDVLGVVIGWTKD